MRTRWLYFLPLALMVAAPMEGEGTRARDTRRHLVVPQAAQQAATPVHVAPSIKQSEGRPTGIIPPGGTPPTGTPASDDTSEESTQPVQDAHRDYRGQLPVFPGAEGFGSTTPAGRGGRILRVTTLANSGPGSFRAAVTSAGPRTVIFEVGGIIHLKSAVEVTEPFLTIAGQTAPSPGITLTGDVLRFETHDVLLQHLRIRPGDAIGDPDTNTPLRYRDGLSIRTNPSGSPHTYNIYVDHCSVSWAIDENVSLWYPNVYDVTISNCIVSEGLTRQKSPGVRTASKGMIVGHGQRRIASVRNLFAHNDIRNPMFTDDSTGMVVNNVIYNSWLEAVVMGGGVETGTGPVLLTVAGNVYLTGSNSRPERRTIMAKNDYPETRLFVADNIGPYSSGDPWSVVDFRISDPSEIKSHQSPVSVAPLTVLPAAETLGRVLADAGARAADRDAIDRRIVEDVRQGTGQTIDTPSQVGGLPRTGSAFRRLRTPRDPAGDADGDGYTNLEEWLHCMADRVESPARTFLSDCPGPN